VLGGLLVSTIITLVLLPVFYVLSDGRRFRAQT
jgi:multidrug efflux pump subunit AcrB